MKELKAEIGGLRKENRQLRRINKRLQRANDTLEQAHAALQQSHQEALARIKALEAQVGQNSRNSHWPSSRDKGRRKKRTKSLRRKSDKPAGGQKGHAGQTLKASPTPDEVVIHRPQQCQHCQAPFADEQEPVALEQRQVHDLPPLQIVVTEHQAVSLCCAACQQVSRGRFPAEVQAPVQYGPRIQQLALYLKVEQFVPYERSRRFFKDVFGLALSPGTLQNIITRAGRRVRPVVAQIKQALQAGSLLHCDESGFYIGGTRHWLHVASTPRLSCFYPHRKRGSTATRAMGILPHFTGRAMHDYWSAYYQYDQCQHALCNVHHLRDLTAVAEDGQPAWATRFKRLLLSAKAAVAQAREQGAAALAPAKVQQIERLYDQLVSAALRANPPPAGGWSRAKRGRPKKSKARNLAERFERHRDQVLAFVYDFKVPFDNNLAERDSRMLKVQQKISGCFRSAQGAQDFCDLRSYLSSIRKQRLSVWDALASLFSNRVLIPDLTPV